MADQRSVRLFAFSLSEPRAAVVLDEPSTKCTSRARLNPACKEKEGNRRGTEKIGRLHAESARRHPQRPLNEEASTDSDAVCVRLRAIISPPAWGTHTPTQDGSARTVSGPSAESRSWGTAYAALLSHAV